MTDIAQFLAARFDEEQQLAEAVECARAWSPGRGLGVLDGHPVVRAEDGETSELVAIAEAEPPAAVAQFIACHDPARVLADIAAKRRILPLHVGYHHCTSYAPDGNGLDWAPTAGSDDDPHDACDTLKLFAAPYRDHPDFDPAWTVPDA